MDCAIKGGRQTHQGLINILDARFIRRRATQIRIFVSDRTCMEYQPAGPVAATTALQIKAPAPAQDSLVATIVTPMAPEAVPIADFRQ